MTICPKCNGNTEEIVKDYEVDGIKFKNVIVTKCLNCGNEFVMKENLNQLFDSIKDTIDDNSMNPRSDEENKIIAEHISKLKFKCNLKEKMREEKLPSKDLAARISVTPQRINKIKKQGINVSIKTALMIAAAIPCDVNELYQLVEDDKDKSKLKQQKSNVINK